MTTPDLFDLDWQHGRADREVEFVMDRPRVRAGDREPSCHVIRLPKNTYGGRFSLMFLAEQLGVDEAAVDNRQPHRPYLRLDGDAIGRARAMGVVVADRRTFGDALLRMRQQYRIPGQHRTPPVKLIAGGKGICRLCQQEIYEPTGDTLNRRRSWHTGCYQVWCIATQASYARWVIEERDRCICAGCGKLAVKARQGRVIAYPPRYGWSEIAPHAWGDYSAVYWDHDWENDHIVALAEAPRALWYWLPGNMQTLCTACHKAKTAEQAARKSRARGRKRSNGFAQPSLPGLEMEEAAA